MMTKVIVIPSCKVCPYRKAHGGFGAVVGVPYCEKGATMTYTVESVQTPRGTYRQCANPDYIIPSNCPLEDEHAAR